MNAPVNQTSRFLPRTLTPNLRAILPSHPTVYGGPGLAVWAVGVYLLLIVARSLIHLLAPDGGAQSIATIDVHVTGGDNIIALFGQWGASQLLLAFTLVILLLRYRGFTPLIALILTVEPVLRRLAGALKPVHTMGIAPGAALNDWAGLLMLVVAYIAVCPAPSGVRSNRRR